MCGGGVTSVGGDVWVVPWYCHGVHVAAIGVSSGTGSVTVCESVVCGSDSSSAVCCGVASEVAVVESVVM